MNFTINQLGIFELIGYLFSGIYAFFVLALPFLIAKSSCSRNELDQLLNSLDHLPINLKNPSFFEGAIILALAYALGLLLSQASSWYYNGFSKCPWGLFPLPEMHPLYPYPLENSDIWKRVNEKFNDQKLFENILQKIEPKSKIYEGLAYFNQYASIIFGIAAVVKFTSSIVLSTSVSIVLNLLLLFFCQNILLSFCVLLIEIVWTVSFHYLARDRANVYWKYIAMSYLCRPPEKSS